MSDDGNSDPQPARMIHDIRRHVKQVRFQYVDELRDCRLSTQTKRELASAALKYWDVLYEHRNESILDDSDIPDLSPIEDRLGETVQVRVSSKRLGQKTTTKQVPAIDGLNPEFILEATRKLDDMAKKLGFAASVEEKMATYGVDPAWEEDDGNTAD